MGHWKYQPEQRLAMTGGARQGALHRYMLEKYLLNEGVDCTQRVGEEVVEGAVHSLSMPRLS